MKKSFMSVLLSLIFIFSTIEAFTLGNSIDADNQINPDVVYESELDTNEIGEADPTIVPEADIMDAQQD